MSVPVEGIVLLTAPVVERAMASATFALERVETPIPGNVVSSLLLNAMLFLPFRSILRNRSKSYVHEWPVATELANQVHPARNHVLVRRHNPRSLPEVAAHVVDHPDVLGVEQVPGSRREVLIGKHHSILETHVILESGLDWGAVRIIIHGPDNVGRAGCIGLNKLQLEVRKVGVIQNQQVWFVVALRHRKVRWQ